MCLRLVCVKYEKKRSKGKVEIEMKHFSVIKYNWIFVIYKIFNLKKDAE